MNLMTVDGFSAKIEYDSDSDRFRGEILGLNGGAEFYGANPNELRLEFKKSLDIFLEVCQENCIEPWKQFSGKFNLRIPPELHERLAMAAQAQGKSLNSLVWEALERSVTALIVCYSPPCLPLRGSVRRIGKSELGSPVVEANVLGHEDWYVPFETNGQPSRNTTWQQVRCPSLRRDVSHGGDFPQVERRP